MCFILSAIGLLCFSGLISFLARNKVSLANSLGAGGAMLGCLAGLVPAIWILWTGNAEKIRYEWSIPYGSFSMQIDSLSAFFLVPIFILCGLSALYGLQYMNTARNRNSLGNFGFSSIYWPPLWRCLSLRQTACSF